MNSDIINEKMVLGDTVKIQGFVEIRNGDTVIYGKNRFVQTLLQTIMNLISGSTCSRCFFSGPILYHNMYLGSDTITPTTYNTTTLTTPIGTNPGTPPTSITGGVTNPSAGVFNMALTSTWVSGSLPAATVGEMALYLNMYPAGNLFGFGWGGSYTPSGAILASRLSVADGSFSKFTINTNNPLIITWTIQLNF